MTVFEYVAAVFALIVGLGVTRLLSAGVEVFRRRRECPLHAVPLIWAALIFCTQMQFMWATFELSEIVTGWTRGLFLLILALALLLFVAGALVFPGSSEGAKTLREGFEATGRWALACLSAYFLLAFMLNPVFFGGEMWSYVNVFALASALGPALYLRFGRGRLAATITGVSILVILYSLWLFSPAAYT